MFLDVLSRFGLGVSFLVLDCECQCSELSGKSRLRSHPLCVETGVKCRLLVV